jgi:hypothetical protein
MNANCNRPLKNMFLHSIDLHNHINKMCPKCQKLLIFRQKSMIISNTDWSIVIGPFYVSNFRFENLIGVDFQFSSRNPTLSIETINFAFLCSIRVTFMFRYLQPQRTLLCDFNWLLNF